MKKWILAGLAGFVFSFGITLATRAEAAPGQEVETYYYSDDTFTTQVGYSYAGCDTRDKYSRGTKTAYYKQEWSACYPDDGGGVGCYDCTKPICDSTGCMPGSCGQVICP
jgi:hypothetical protein